MPALKLLASIAGTTLREEACDFSLSPKRSKDAVYKSILAFRKDLTLKLVAYMKELPAPPLARLLRKVRAD